MSSLSVGSQEPPPKNGENEEENEDPPDVIRAAKVPKSQRQTTRTYVDYSVRVGELENQTRITMANGQPGLQKSITMDVESGPSKWRCVHMPDDFNSLHAKLFDSFFALRFPDAPKFEDSVPDGVENSADGAGSSSTKRRMSHAKSLTSLAEGRASPRKTLSHSRTQMLHENIDKEISRIHGIMDEEGNAIGTSGSGRTSTAEYLVCYLKELVTHQMVSTSSSMLAFLELNKAHRVVSIGDFEFCKSFRFSADELNYVGNDGRTILHHAALGGVSDIISWLLDRGRAVRLNVNSQDKNGFTALHVAASKGHDHVAQALVSHNADPKLKNRDGEIPLHLACLVGSDSVVQILVHADPQGVNITDDSGKTPLHVSVLSNAENIALILLRLAQTDPSISDIDGHTPLHYAASNNMRQAVLSMVQKGIDVNKADASGKTVLHHACCSGSEGGDELAFLLLNVPGIDISLPDHNYMTPLHYCAREGLYTLAEKLAEKEPLILTKQDGTGRTPLHWMVVNNNVAIVKRFLEMGASSDVQDSKGNTSLLLAVTERENQKDLEVFSVLGAFNANTELRDINDHTALMRAALLGLAETAAELVKIGADPETVLSENGNTALHLAATAGKSSVLTALVSVGADVGAMNEKGESPLHMAIRSGKYGAAKTLAEIGADLDQKDNEGKSVGKDLAPPALLPQLKAAAAAYADALGGESSVAEKRKKMAKLRIQRKQSRKVGFGKPAAGLTINVVADSSISDEVISPTGGGGVQIASKNRSSTLTIAPSKVSRRLSSPIGFIRCEEEPEGEPLDPAIEQLFIQLVTKDSDTTKFMRMFLTEEDREPQNIARLDCLYLLQEIQSADDDQVPVLVEKVIKNHMLPASNAVVPLPKSIHNRVMASTSDAGEKRQQIASCREHLIRYFRNNILPLFLKGIAYGKCYTFIQEQEQGGSASSGGGGDVRQQWLEASQEVLVVKFDLPSDENSMLQLVHKDVVLCLDKTSEADGWWFGVNQKGEQGYFPPQYCEIISDVHEQEKVLKECGLMDNDDSMKAKDEVKKDDKDEVKKDDKDDKDEMNGLLADLDIVEKHGAVEGESEKEIEERKRKEEEDRAAAEARRREEEERKRKEAEERKHKEEEERKKKQEEERQRKEEEERKRKEEEAKRQADAESRKKAEDAMKRKMEEEEAKRKKEEEEEEKKKKEAVSKKPLPPTTSAPARAPPSIPKQPPPFTHQKSLPQLPKIEPTEGEPSKQSTVQRLSRRFTQTDMASALKPRPPPPQFAKPNGGMPLPADIIKAGTMPAPPVGIFKAPLAKHVPTPPAKDKRSKSMGFIFSGSKDKEAEKVVEPVIQQPGVTLEGIMTRSRSLKRVTIAPTPEFQPVTTPGESELGGILAHRRSLKRTIPPPVVQQNSGGSVAVSSNHNKKQNYLLTGQTSPPCPEPDCDCIEFAAHPFKKKQCKNCFHEHS